MKLNDTSLLRMQAYINGRWEDADSGATVEVLNPATGDRLGTVPKLAVAQVRRSIQAAHQGVARVGIPYCARPGRTPASMV
jgi:succinate-semialdehyde dehydrogenase / glutarate-semialdehyde dehydrogenase